jgi:hypothetical protein
MGSENNHEYFSTNIFRHIAKQPQANAFGLTVALRVS